MRNIAGAMFSSMGGCLPEGMFSSLFCSGVETPVDPPSASTSSSGPKASGNGKGKRGKVAGKTSGKGKMGMNFDSDDEASRESTDRKAINNTRFYELLGIEKTATTAKVKKSYYLSAKKHHAHLRPST